MNNWKTTLLGALAAFLHLYANGMSVKSAAAALALGALGAAAKDGDVTGGTRAAT